jgi:DNA-directed RNA polymerase subunit beta'
MLMALDMVQEKEDLLRNWPTTKSELKPKKIIKRLKVVNPSSIRATAPSG